MDNKDLVNIGEKPEKQKRPPRPDKTAILQPGDGGHFVGNAIELFSLPEIDTNDAKAVYDRVIEYFEITAKNDVKPSVAGLALALNIDRSTLYDWVHRGTKSNDVTLTLKKAYRVLNLMMEDYMQNGKINPVSGIFLMKNNLGYRDQQEVVVTPNDPLGEKVDRKELEKKYLESLPIIDVDYSPL